MSHITSLMIFNLNYKEKELETLFKKIYDLTDFDIKTDTPVKELFKRQEITECFGSKWCEFGPLYFCGINYFPLNEFKKWFNNWGYRDEFKILVREDNADDNYFL